MSDWRFHIVSTNSGSRYMETYPASFQGDVSLNMGVGGSCVIPFAAHPGEPKTFWESLTRPVNRTLVVSYKDIAVWAGVIWKRKYSKKDESFTLTMRDLWSVLERRYLIDPSVKPAASHLSFGPATLPHIAVRLVQHAANDPTWRDDLPVVFPTAAEYPTPQSTDPQLNYLGYQASTSAEALERVIGWQGGPDIWFKPVMDSDDNAPFRWHMQSQKDLNAEKVIGIHLDGGASAVDYEVEESAEGIINRAYVFGVGNGKATASAQGFHTGTKYLQLDGMWQDRKTTQEHHLQRFADERVLLHAGPEYSHTVSIAPDGLPGLLDEANSRLLLEPGMSVHRRSDDDPWLDAEKNFRLTGYKMSVDAAGAGTIALDLRG